MADSPLRAAEAVIELLYDLGFIPPLPSRCGGFHKSQRLAQLADESGMDLVELAEHLETEEAAQEGCKCRSSE